MSRTPESIDLEKGSLSSSKTDVSTDLKYKLPELVESARQGWLSSGQGAILLSAVLSVAQIQLLVMVKTPDPDPNFRLRDTNPGAFRFLLLLSYSAFIFYASAGLASLLMIDRLGDIPLRAKKYLDANLETQSPVDVDYLLEIHNAGGRWTWMRWHCLLSLIAGSWCMTLQIFLYIYLHEPTAVWIPMAVVCAIGVSPWFGVLKSD